MRDIDLVRLAQAGDELAMRRILHRYEGLLHALVSPYFLKGGEEDDLLQEARFGVFKAIRDFRADAGSGFANFLSICVRRQVITAVKAADRSKHSPLNEAISLRSAIIGGSDFEDPLLEEVLADERRPDPSAALESKEDFRAVRRAFGSLSEVEREAVTGIAEGLSYAEVAELAQRNIKQVDNAHQRAKRKIRKELEAAA